ncbi:glycosyltransferase [Streptomyces sp. NPDC060064]|uniref:glycosyltransferase n=1 Tax=Streptomyces sp. NPDC060064 TaxID=3347049 RepID=UPI00369A68B1
MKLPIPTPGYEPVIGGAETYTVSLARGLVRAGHGVTIATAALPGQAGARRDEAGVLVVGLPRPDGWADRHDALLWEQMAFGLLPGLEPLAREADVIHANSHDTALTASILAADTGSAAIATSHEQDPESEPGGTGRCRLVYGTLALDTIICRSRYYLDMAVRHGSAGREVLVPHGIDCVRFNRGDRGAARRELGLPEHGKVLVCGSRFKQRKGLLELVNAFAELAADRCGPVHAVIAGTASSGSVDYEQTLRNRLRELGLDEIVAVRTDLGWEQMPTLWRAADVAVQPSYSEGLGLSVLEAMASQVPVVGTDVPGLREVIAHELTATTSGCTLPCGGAWACHRRRGPRCASRRRWPPVRVGPSQPGACGGGAGGHLPVRVRPALHRPGEGGGRCRPMSPKPPPVLWWTNDEGWSGVYAHMLGPSVKEGEIVVAFSVYGGAGGWSDNLVNGLKLARERGVRTIGFAGDGGGQFNEVCDVTILVPQVPDYLVAPETESLHVSLFHLVCTCTRSGLSTGTTDG